MNGTRNGWSYFLLQYILKKNSEKLAERPLDGVECSKQTRKHDRGGVSNTVYILDGSTPAEIETYCGFK